MHLSWKQRVICSVGSIMFRELPICLEDFCIFKTDYDTFNYLGMVIGLNEQRPALKQL